MGLTPAERNRQVQIAAGGLDRLETDDGGHFIAARFGGPGIPSNLFPQDSNFNRSSYKRLENQWAKDLAAGKTVSVQIDVYYPDPRSQRPAGLTVTTYINGIPQDPVPFVNRRGGL